MTSLNRTSLYLKESLKNQTSLNDIRTIKFEMIANERRDFTGSALNASLSFKNKDQIKLIAFNEDKNIVKSLEIDFLEIVMDPTDYGMLMNQNDEGRDAEMFYGNCVLSPMAIQYKISELLLLKAIEN